MRLLITLCGVLLLCGLANGQISFGHGHSDWTPPGVYSEPFKPITTTPFAALDSLRTPSISLDPVIPAAGASNATVGATVVYAQPGFYGPLPASEEQGKDNSSDREATRTDVRLNARFESSFGAAQLLRRPNGHSRLYTNPDVERVNETNGLVKYGGRTARLG